MESQQAQIGSSELQERIQAAAKAVNMPVEHVGWVVKALHPACSSIESGGMPDTTYSSAVRPEYRLRNVYSTPTPGTAWDCCVWMVPGDLDIINVTRGAIGTDFTTTCDATNWIALQTSSLVGAGGLQDLTTGTTTGAQGRRAAWNAAGWRYRYSSLTVEVTAPMTEAQGTVVASQLDPQAFEYVSSYSNATQEVRRQKRVLIPRSEAAIALQDPKYYAGKAIDGVYLPLRLCGPDQPYVYSTDCPPLVLRESSLVARAAFGISPITMCLTPLTPPLSIETINFTMPQGVTNLDRVNHAVVIFRGLGANTSITIKGYCGFEILSAPSGALAPMTSRPAEYSPAAIDLYYRLAHEMDNCYPSRYNSLGALAGVIANLVPKVLPYVAPFAETALKMISGAGSSRQQPAPPPAAREPAIPRRQRSVAQTVPLRERSRSRSVSVSRPTRRKRRSVRF